MKNVTTLARTTVPEIDSITDKTRQCIIMCWTIMGTVFIDNILLMCFFFYDQFKRKAELTIIMGDMWTVTEGVKGATPGDS